MDAQFLQNPGPHLKLNPFDARRQLRALYVRFPSVNRIKISSIFHRELLSIANGAKHNHDLIPSFAAKHTAELIGKEQKEISAANAIQETAIQLPEPQTTRQDPQLSGMWGILIPLISFCKSAISFFSKSNPAKEGGINSPKMPEPSF